MCLPAPRLLRGTRHGTSPDQLRQTLATDKTAWIDADSKLFFREPGLTAAQKEDDYAVVASNDPASGQSDAGTPTGLGASVSGSLQPGRYYLRIDTWATATR
ncbi:hypothetical protein [Kribbella sp. VKM Ac-2569]|uniref:hypothetical protein n=1 Tax=Kribbella sp. VKM Ac-2569 TaxID=2512220 RepID=UPI0018E516C3|nr:hypothetical protein [Kribbella sp. VKM Ac-2569]